MSAYILGFGWNSIQTAEVCKIEQELSAMAQHFQPVSYKFDVIRDVMCYDVPTPTGPTRLGRRVIARTRHTAR